MLTNIIPEIIEEPIKAGCAPGNETIGYLAGEISRLRGVLKHIAEDDLPVPAIASARKAARAALTPNAEAHAP